jgi:DNA-binding IclR family transcriptional regulator
LADRIVRETPATATLQTLEKGLLVLEGLAQHGHHGSTLAELVRQFDMNKSSLYRLLVTLMQHGWVERDTTERYRVGLKVIGLAPVVLNDVDVRRVGSPYLRDLSQQVQDTVHLTVLDNDEVVTVDRIEGASPLNIRTQIGNRRPLYCSAAGKAILAFRDDDAVARELSRGLKPLTARTITDPKALVAQLQGIRLRGVAFDDEERIEGVRCVAAPIFDHSEVVGAVSLSAPAFRVSVDQLNELAGPVAETASRISERLGFRPVLLWGRETPVRQP